MERRNLVPAVAAMAVSMLLAGGCGGTLEDKYRRGQLTTSTTGRPAGTAPTSTTGATATTTTTVPGEGNAAGQRAQGEASGPGAGGTIPRSATRRTVVPPSGGRHR